ncbi:MAG TPA: PAS domain-containing protein [Rhizomicrobium sp.]|jgi:hypothetical protein
MKHRNSHLLVGYWDRLRKGREVPDQTDIDPRAIKRILAHVFILESSDPGRPLYRLAGTSHCEQYGGELKGMSFLARWESESRSSLATVLRQALRVRQPVCISSIGATETCGMVELETVLAPVTFGDGAPTRFVGMTLIVGDPAARAGQPITFERLLTSRLVSEREPGAPLDLPPPPRLVSAKAPHLRLVVNRDKPMTVHCDMDTAMRQLIETLEIVIQPKLSLVS